MSTEEQEHTKVALTQHDVGQIKKDVLKVSDQVRDIHQAIVGSEIGKDGGLVQRVVDCESSIEKLEERIVEMEQEASKRETYVRIIWALAASLVTMLVGGALIHYFYGTPPKLP